MRVALVTGASSGMGLIYSRKLAERGYDLLLVSNQTDALIQTAADIADEFGVSAIPHYQDLAVPEAASCLYDYCLAEGLEVEILVNNAGMFFFKELDCDDVPRVEKMMTLHMSTVTKLCLLFGEDMKRRGCGYILIVSSMAAKLPTPGIAVYSATKAYLKSFGKSLYFEMKPYGVGVTTVCPAAIATPLYGLNPRLMDLGVKTGVIKTPEWLVKRALRGMFRRRPVIKPGLMNLYLPPMVRLLPGGLECRIWNKLKQ
ncbi:MAG: SDR family NAD(P)-dependent oxidoreductase [Bacteroidales bacterium]|nr:SDR family NAD(P)-dependent oxidoreductase [Bacteroidales bacterium]